MQLIDRDGRSQEVKTKEDFLRDLDALTKEYFDCDEAMKHAPKKNRSDMNIALLQAETRFKKLLLNAGTSLPSDEFQVFSQTARMRIETLRSIGGLNLQKGKTRQKIVAFIGTASGTVAESIADTSEEITTPSQRLAAALGKILAGTIVGLGRGLWEGGKAGWNIAGKLAA